MGKIDFSVSVCIPVFRTECLLERCLESIKTQTLQNLQIILVDDCSDGQDEKKRNAEKIFHHFKKSCRKERRDFSFKFIRHSKNLGLVEARRSAVLEAEAPFVYILDSDDFLLPQGLEVLWAATQKNPASEIIQGMARVEKNGIQVLNKEEEKGINTISSGTVSGRKIFENFMVHNSISGYLIGKLISTSLYRKALDVIPFMECTMNEEILQFFFLSYFAREYTGLEEPVFVYNLDSGITSGTFITDLTRWEKICSSVSVFTFLLTYMAENKAEFTEAEQMSIKKLCRKNLERIIKTLSFVHPDILSQAYGLLCDYWGTDFVQELEGNDNQNKKSL